MIFVMLIQIALQVQNIHIIFLGRIDGPSKAGPFSKTAKKVLVKNENSKTIFLHASKVCVFCTESFEKIHIK